MKKCCIPVVAFLLLLGWAELPRPAACQESAVGLAIQALKNKDFPAAIEICLDGLRRNPTDYELNFLLSRAYAYSGQWDKALTVLNELALVHAENTDVLLMRARIESWKKNYDTAEKGYKAVLKLSPGNPEALIGLAEIASWQRNYAKSVFIYRKVVEQEPVNPDIYFRIGRVYLWEGNYQKAKENLRTALRFDPKNAEYKQTLEMTSPRFKPKYELRYEYQAEGFNDGRETYRDQNLVLQVNLFPNFGPVLFGVNQTRRYGQQDFRFGVELYPHLWKGAYADLSFAYSPRATHYPNLGFQVELYQGVFSAAEFSLGYRRMNFAENTVSLYLGSLGYYWGKYYAVARLYYSPEKTEGGFAWIANLRRYFSEESYLVIGYGRGSMPVDTVTLEDLLFGPSHVFLAGLNWYVFQRIRLELYFTMNHGEDIQRNALFVGMGYRW